MSSPRPRLAPTRRALITALGLGAVASTRLVHTASSDIELAAASAVAPLRNRPPTLVNPIVVDLSQFDPAKPYPGWTGRAASQATVGFYPKDRDLLILGHSDATWTGKGFIRGGRNVIWRGGTYDSTIWLRNFMGDACVEGVYVRFSPRPAGEETGDGLGIVPDSMSAGRSRIAILNCRVEGVDGNRQGHHGDIFQMPAMYDVGGYCSSPRSVVIERLTGSTGYQGFFLATQQFGRTIPSVQRITIQDVNLRKIRANTMESKTQESPVGGMNLLYLIDGTPARGGDRPFPMVIRNLYLEPWADEGLNAMMFPRIGSSPVNRLTRTRLQPTIAQNGKTARFPREMLMDGVISYGRPPGGDFAKAAGSSGLGGLDVPGRGYRSPGYR